jgi:hypothetical protein
LARAGRILRRSAQARDDHAYPSAVIAELVAEQRGQVVFFKRDAAKELGRRHGGEQQMPGGHHWR